MKPADSTQQAFSKNKSLEEIVTELQSELESHAKYFHRQASLLAALNDNVLQAEATQKMINHNLEYIESQQNDLSNVLDALEKNITTLNIPSTAVDEQRQKIYSLAEDINKQLNEMSDQMNTVIHQVNSLNDQSDDPVLEIVKILNYHLESLNWIDKATIDLRQKLVASQK
ncbi:hypothetical protein ROZALSC1DRAFT_28280 [Rozella allomycis CSF55]|uniref:Nucleoporin NSP1/NUP62 domain-containing protein n=1 Tax=Rozella allomycis (strain CSF55) TaxID=988480 RepID=A0A075APN0_ROZAC|nr:Nucleoporin NSP1/NUP62 domain-containing protein [Rozella allomycis CSF55]RKP20217.1 hypothetical protein ROZALSC1DRAFT_28280 [Rozella allomycis CSF55]|eukprot:EPZ32104.1 Nucleoporin NSP1/NUP62 domain-containing protein [Rozella allomycis CSF55]